MPENSLLHALRRLSEGAELTGLETAAAFGTIMRGEATPTQIAGLLLGIRARGETPDQVAGAVGVLREAMVPVSPPPGPPVIDTCGTGGGTVGTFNLSTASAFVAVGAGARVAKHGNRSFTSRCGSADLLEALGIELVLSPERAAQVLAGAGMVFLFAPAYHPAMRYVAPVRKELGIPTIMNLLGPLANPASVVRQVVGVADQARAPLVAEALRRLGAAHALVVHAEVGMDEISPGGRTLVWEIRDGGVKEWILDPSVYGLAHDDLASLAGGDPAANAERVMRLLEGAKDPAGKAAVLLNSAAAIYVAGLEASFAKAVERARESVSCGAARQALERLQKEAGRAAER